jgi:hypothetical protein
MLHHSLTLPPEGMGSNQPAREPRYGRKFWGLLEHESQPAITTWDELQKWRLEHTRVLSHLHGQKMAESNHTQHDSLHMPHQKEVQHNSTHATLPRMSKATTIAHRAI